MKAPAAGRRRSDIIRASLSTQDSTSDSPSLEAPTPRLYGDIDANFGRLIAFVALLIENSKFCVSFVQLLRNPKSRAWILGTGCSVVLEVLKRSGLWNKAQIVIGLPSLGRTTALKVAYFRAGAGVGYMSPMLLLSLGCVRAGFLRRWDAIIFLDVSATMPFLLASQFAAELFEDVLVHGLERPEFVKFEPVGTLALAHPLRDFSIRHFTAESYGSVFCVGIIATAWILIGFIGPGFAFGAKPVFLNSVPDRWLVANNASAWNSPLDLLGSNGSVP